MSDGKLHSINVSSGGVPKLRREAAAVKRGGVEGDRQRDLEHHGGPQRAVSLYSLELIEKLRAEGHPIVAGAIGENLTLAGIDWSAMTPGRRLEVGAVKLELTSYAAPCNIIAGAFHDGRSSRVAQKTHAGWSRLYARVLQEGGVRIGDRVRLVE